MAYDPYFGDAIWTKHALARLSERRLSQEMAYSAFKSPDRSFPGKQYGTTEYRKYYGKSLVTIIAKQNEEGEWVILSCWINPPLAGTKDAYKREQYIKYKKASFWARVWMDLKYLVGLS